MPPRRKPVGKRLSGRVLPGGKASQRERRQARSTGRTEMVACPSRGRHGRDCLCGGSGQIEAHK